MRILITSPVFPPDLGGPAVYVPSLAAFLLEREHQLKVVAFCSEPEPKGHPFPVVTVPRGPLPIRYLKAFFAVLREAKDVDVVYVQEHLALLHVLAAKLRGKPAVIRMMVDGAWEISHRKGWCDGDDIVTFGTKTYGWKVSLAQRLQRRWWSWCQRIISCSEFLRQIAIQRYGVGPDKVVRIVNAYHGVDPEDAELPRAEARQRLGLPEGQRHLLTICRLMVWKGVDGILRALAELPPDVHLHIAGDGDMEATWKELATDLGIADRAHFLGNVPHDLIPTWIRAADVFVLNSEYEGLSHTLLEVSVLGTPAVCTGVCGNPEVVEEGVNGFTVPPKDDAALRAAIAKLLDDEALRERFAAAGRKKAEGFTRAATFPLVEDVLRDAAASAR
ncbi:MAG: glycosyltransferase family 4 protein [Planctomycetota bacterium]